MKSQVGINFFDTHPPSNFKSQLKINLKLKKNWKKLKQPRNTDFQTNISNFLRKKKKLKTLTQQRNTDFHTSIFSNQKSWVSFLYISLFSCNNATLILKRTYKILKKKSWKRLKQPRNTDFRTHISNFLRKKKSWKLWRNNATLIFTHPYSTTKNLMHATMPHWFWNAPIKFWKKWWRNHATLIFNENTDFFKEEEKNCLV